MSRRRDIKNLKRASRNTSEDVNPMDYISNLVDAMLVLAVGIMLALVMNWNIDMTEKQEEAKQAQNHKVPTFADDNLQAVDEKDVKDKSKMEQSGTVYYDPDTKTYYLMKE